MIELFDTGTGEPIGSIAEADLQFLIDHLEEESLSDQDYYVDTATLQVLSDQGAPSSLVELLRSALGDREGFELRWQRD